MNGKVVGNNKWSQHRRGMFKYANVNAWMTAVPGHRYNGYRSKRDERLMAALELRDPISVEPVRLDTAEDQQRIALSAWEDEGGKVKLSAPRRGDTSRA